jgi:Rrf2 family protein
MQFTRASDYAVRVLSYLANANGSVSRAQSIAAATDIPESFLAKILGQLSHAGMVRSHRGARGGFSLAVDPRAVSLLNVVEAMEGPLRLNLCATPEPCVYSGRCPIQKVWQQAEESLRETLRSQKILDLAAECNAVHLFLKQEQPVA